MINITRICAIMVRHLIPTFREPIRICDMFYWPLVDITLFGFMATWAQETMAENSSFMLALITCVALWYLIQRTTLEIARNILMELGDRHLLNLFATPLSLTEFLIALMMLGVIQAFITFIYTLIITWIFYSLNIFTLLIPLLPFIFLFICSGWIIGFIIASMLFVFGRGMDTLTWATLWFFAMVSGAFYPVKLFPLWLQKISYVFPTTYLFEGVREMIVTNVMPIRTLSMGAVLTVLYFIATFLLVNWAFERSKSKGLAQLE